ncbi:MAG TPA: tetratricopeptide repeat protein [Tepidisphaeraceae bacterium]|jgi:predicted O-linked N-acetylglucosamine transferase (SPINDLY family)
MIPIPEQLRLATDHYRAGRLPQARDAYAGVLAQETNHPIALFFLSVISQQTGQLDSAVDFLRRAVSTKPDFAQAQCNLGALLASLGRSEEAIAPLQAAVQYQPDNVDALFNLAAALADCHRYEQAIEIFQRTIQLSENFPQAHYELGNALIDTNRAEEAIRSYERAIHFDPNFADAWCNLASALCERGDYVRAAAAGQRAIALAPQNAVAHSNLADALRNLGQYKQALAACEQAIRINPDFPDAYVNLAAVYCDQTRIHDAIRACESALQRNGQCASAHSLLAELLRSQKKLDEAEKHAQMAIVCDPKLAGAHRNLGNIYKDQGRMLEAVDSFRRAVELRPTLANFHSTLAFSVTYCPGYTSERILAEAQNWAEMFEKPLLDQATSPLTDINSNRRLRIGYVSADLRNHPVGRSLFALLAHHDRQKFEVHCYSNSPQRDSVTDQLRSHCDGWQDIVGLTDQQLAEQIGKDKIDILLDLGLHTGGNRLLVFARKPARIQITWLGYPGTTGMTQIDYRLSDPYLDPPEQGGNAYSEKTIRLPNSFWCFDARMLHDTPEVNALPARTNEFVTFGCLNNFCKINQPLLELWREVLEAVPRSRLLLLAAEGSCREWIRKTLGDRVEFVPHAPRQQYLKYYHQMDIGLDTLPYGGHTTSFDSFWMGVPVVTLIGSTIVGRAGASLLANLGLSELIATSREQLIQITGDLARDSARLEEIRKMLRQRTLASPLMDGSRFAKDMENIYRDVFEHLQKKA